MKKAIRILLAILLVSVVALTVTACSENQDPCAKGHSWDNGQITKPATCAETGTAVYRCKVCGQTEERTLPVTQDHVWDEGKVTTEPTCTQKGVKTYTCTVCKTATRPEDIEATGQHAKGTHVTQVDPTCHSEGTKEYWLCKDNCGTKLNEEGYIVQDSDLVIAPLAHNYDNGVVTTEATCQHDGVKTFTCQNDGCSESYTQKLPKLAHNYDNGVVTTEATCQQEGVKTFTCQNDGCSESFTQTLPKLAHSFGRLVERVEPNCEQAGHIAYYQCAQCKQFFDEGKQPVDEDALVLNALGHTPQQVEGKAPDCTNSGFETYYKCTRCNKLFEDMECEKQIDKPVVLPATGHLNRQKIEPIPADCTHGGKTEGWRCADCGATLIEPKNTAPLGHSFIYTSDNDGVHHTVTCARCDYNKTEECTPAQAWQFDGDYHWHKCTVCSGDLTHEPHALQAGSKQCTECGKEVSEIIVQVEGATDHQVANLAEALNYIKQNYPTTPATIVLTDDRGATADVTFDGNIDVTLNMSGFGINMGSYRIVVEGNANVTLTNGTLDGKVQFNGGKLVLDGVSGNYLIALKADLHCNDADVTVNGAQLDHTWNNGQVTTPPTCEGTGTRTFTCTRCQATRTEDEPAKGHTYGTIIPKQEPTCTATGTDAHYQCADCHKLFVDENGVKKEVQANELVLDKLAHTYKFDNWTWDEKTFKTATAHFSCNVCGHTEQVEVKLIEQDRTPSSCVEQGKVEYRLEKDAIVGGVTAPSQTFTQTLPLAEHVYGEKHPAVQATCSNKGNKEYYQCSECEQYFVEEDGVKVPADWNDIETQIDETNHKYKEEWSFDGTNHWYECEYNPEHKTGVTGHEWQYEKSTKDGSHIKTCKYCDVKAKEEECTPDGGDDKHDDTHGLKKGFYADADHHWQVCQFCEKQFGYEKHSYKFVSDGNTQHHEQCTVCGNNKSPVAHTRGDISYAGNWQHTYKCPDCDQIVTEDCVPELNVCECGKDFTVDEILDKLETLNNTDYSENWMPGTYVLSGIVTKVENSNGYIDVWFTVEGDSKNRTVEVYGMQPGLETNVEGVIVGASITVSGELQHYGSTLEFGKNKGKLDQLTFNDVQVDFSYDSDKFAYSIVSPAEVKEKYPIGSEIQFTIEELQAKWLVKQVTVNGDVVDPDKNGVYKFTVQGATTVQIEGYEWGTAQETTLARFEFGENSTTEQNIDGGSDLAINATETNNGYELKFTTCTKVWKTHDSKGISVLKLGTGDVNGEIAFTVPNGVSKVYIWVANYKAKTTTLLINGSQEQAIDSKYNTNDGTYFKIEIDTSTNKIVTIVGGANGDHRFAIDAIEFYGVAECTHPEKWLTWSKGFDSSCATTGERGHYTCQRCDKYFDEDKQTVIEDIVIPTKEHSLGGWQGEKTAEGVYQHYKECSSCKQHFETTTCTPNETWEFDDDNHFKKCTVCSQVVSTGAHTYTKDPNKCDVCTMTNPKHVHVWEDSLATSYVAPQCEKPGVLASVYCSSCEKRFPSKEQSSPADEIFTTEIEALGHNIEGVAFTHIDDTQHGQYCDRCEQYVNKDSHTFTVEQGSKVDDTYHTAKCICGDSKQEMHNFQDASGAYNKNCDCGEVRISSATKNIKWVVSDDNIERKKDFQGKTLTADGGNIIISGTATCYSNNADDTYADEIRVYQNKDFTITSAKYKMVKIVFTLSGSSYHGNIVPSSGDWSYSGTTATWTGGAYFVTFENGGTTNVQFRFKSVEIFYEVTTCPHTWVDNGESTPPDCATEQNGKQPQICIRCGETKDLEIPFEHQLRHVEEQLPATCKDTGYKSHWECDICKEWFEETSKEKINDHNDIAVTKNHTYIKEDGSKTWTNNDEQGHYYFCTDCGQMFDADGQVITEKIKHELSYSKDETEHWQVCSVCGWTSEHKTHDYNTDKHQCVCGKEDPDFAHKHQFDDVVTAKDPTCTSQGNVEYKQCKDETCHKYFPADALETCGDEGAIDNPFIEPVDHEYEYDGAKVEPIEDENQHGVQCKWFDECGQWGKKGSHNTNGTVSKIEGDETNHNVACSVCGKNTAVPHAWSATPTQVDEQNHKFTCQCGAEKTDVHTFNAVKDGRIDDYTHSTKCACGATDTANHDWGEGAYGSDTRHDCACGEPLCVDSKTVTLNKSALGLTGSNETDFSSSASSKIIDGLSIKYEKVSSKDTYFALQSGKDASKKGYIYNDVATSKRIVKIVITFQTYYQIILSLGTEANPTNEVEMTSVGNVYTWNATDKDNYNFFEIRSNSTGGNLPRISKIEITLDGTPHLWGEGQVTQTGSCADGTPTITTYTCLRCGKTKEEQEKVEHVFVGTPEYDGANGHHIKCQNCENYSESTLCENTLKWEITNETHRRYCTVCDHSYVEKEEHSFAYTDNKNNTHHKYCSVCAWKGVDEGHDLDGDTGACKANGCTFGHNDNFQVGVDGAKYADLSTAVQNAGGQTIYLRATNYAFEGASLNGDFTLDLGTHTLSLTSALTLSGTVTITDGTIEGGLVATGKLTLQGVTIVVDSAVLTVQGSGKVDVDEDCKFLASAGADTNTGKIVLDGSGVSGQFASAIENYNVSVTNNTCDQLTAKVTFGGQGISHSYSEKQCVYCGEAEPAPTVTKKTFTINFETFYDSIGQSSTDMSSGKITLGDYTYNCNNIYQGAQSLSGGLKEYYLILNDQGAYFANLTEWEGAITKITATVRSGATGKASYSLQLSSKVMSSALDDSAGENKVVYPGGGEHDIIVEVEQSLNLRFFNITQTVSTRKGQITKIVIEYYA